MSQPSVKQRPTFDDKMRARQRVERMLRAYGFTGINELANICNCTTGAIKNWQSAGHVPLDHIYQCHMTTGTSMDQLLHGKSATAQVDESERQALQTKIEQDLLAGVRFRLIQLSQKDSLQLIANGLSQTVLEQLSIQVSQDELTTCMNSSS